MLAGASEESFPHSIKSSVPSRLTDASFVKLPPPAGVPELVAAFPPPSPRPSDMVEWDTLDVVGDYCSGSQVNAREVSVEHCSGGKFRCVLSRANVIQIGDIACLGGKHRCFRSLDGKPVARVDGSVIHVTAPI